MTEDKRGLALDASTRLNSAANDLAQASAYAETRHPTETDFAAAVRVITDYIEDPRSGWSWQRGEAIFKQLNDWQLILFHNQMHAAHDAEKS